MSRGMLWVGALLLAASGCGRSGVLEAGSSDGDSVDAPLPQGVPEAPDVPVGPTVDVGRGLDGPIVFSATQTEVDDCVVLDSGTTDKLQLGGSASLFEVGRRVLVLQMNDAIGTSGETAPVANFGRAGQWEMAEVLSSAGSTVTLTAALANSDYETHAVNGLRAQACLVREYTDVTVADGATVTARPWDGNRGGVIAWMVSGTLTVEAAGHLSGDSSGFRGGLCGTPGNNNYIYSYDVPLGQGGGKGEGLDARFFVLFGRGAVANAGGGGNGLNAGGGGGGGAGRGGIGGGQTNAPGGGVIFGDDPTRGEAGGGAADASRLIFGGGGGAGHLDDLALSRCGGAGGGVLMLRTESLAGAGTVTANGENGPTVFREGGGGAGAGGTIDLIAVSAAGFMGEIAADGGEGGDVTNNSFDTYYGPGGGGGGGTVKAKGVSATVRAVGGREGRNTTNGLSWDADNGAQGITLFP